MVLLNGTLTWYTSDQMTKRKGRLHVEAYKFHQNDAKDPKVEAVFESAEIAHIVQIDEKRFYNFTLVLSSEGGNYHGASVRDALDKEQNEELLEGQIREKLVMRTQDRSAAYQMVTTLQRAMKKYRDRSSNYCIRFAGLQLMRPPAQAGTENVRVSRNHATLALEPMRQIVVEVAVPDDLFTRLSPQIQCGSPIRARPVLFTQGISSNLISATQRIASSASMLAHRNNINADAFVRLEQYVNDLKNVPSSCAASGDVLFEVTSLLQELKVHLQRAETKTNPIDGLPALLVASDLARALGGVKLVNCMSGKDRTGMSVTLEQARCLVRRHGYLSPSKMSHSTAARKDARTAAEIATLESGADSSDAKKSLTVQLAKIMRVSGPRVQICRKSIHKAKFKGSISLFCYRPPKTLSGDVEA